jgi:RES domain-containing protein
VYLADSPAAALLEVCVHTSANDVPPNFILLKIDAPEIQIESIQFGELPSAWQSRLEFTRDLGSAWLQKRQTALLRVPSAIVPDTTNYLLNPSHPDAEKIEISAALSYPFDARLKK